MSKEVKWIAVGVFTAIAIFAAIAMVQSHGRKNQRFVEVERYNGNNVNETVILDVETGVYYLCLTEKGYNGKSAMTPLLDSTGKPISITQLETQSEALTEPSATPAELSPSLPPSSSPTPTPTPSASPDPTPTPSVTSTPPPSPSPFWDYSSEEAQKDFENFLQATLDFLRECEELREERIEKESKSKFGQP